MQCVLYHVQSVGCKNMGTLAVCSYVATEVNHDLFVGEIFCPTERDEMVFFIMTHALVHLFTVSYFVAFPCSGSVMAG